MRWEPSAEWRASSVSYTWPRTRRPTRVRSSRCSRPRGSASNPAGGSTKPCFRPAPRDPGGTTVCKLPASPSGWHPPWESAARRHGYASCSTSDRFPRCCTRTSRHGTFPPRWPLAAVQTRASSGICTADCSMTASPARGTRCASACSGEPSLGFSAWDLGSAIRRSRDWRPPRGRRCSPTASTCAASPPSRATIAGQPASAWACHRTATCCSCLPGTGRRRALLCSSRQCRCWVAEGAAYAR